MQIDDVLIAANRRQEFLRRRRVDIDSSDSRFCSVKNHIFRFLDVEAGASQALEDMCEHTRAIAVSNDEDVRRGSFHARGSPRSALFRSFCS